MGILLLFALSIFFGFCFSESVNRKLERVQLQLSEEKRLRELDKADYERNLSILKATIRELM